MENKKLTKLAGIAIVLLISSMIFSANVAEVSATEPVIAIIDPPSGTWYFTSGQYASIGFMVVVNKYPYDPTDPSNYVELGYYYGQYLHVWWSLGRATYLSSSGGVHFYYVHTASLQSGDPARSYPIKAMLNSYWTSDTVTVYVQYSSGGGGGGCPILHVYDGSQYVDEGLLDIHTGYNGADLAITHVLTQAPQPVDHMYLLRLTEHWSTTSHIDQVKLYATLEDGTTVRLPLVSATHSEYGNVLPQLLRSDDRRADLLGAMWNNGTSQTIDLRFVALPSFVHGVSYTFMIEGYNPYPTY